MYVRSFSATTDRRPPSAMIALITAQEIFLPVPAASAACLSCMNLVDRANFFLRGGGCSTGARAGGGEFYGRWSRCVLRHVLFGSMVGSALLYVVESRRSKSRLQVCKYIVDNNNRSYVSTPADTRSVMSVTYVHSYGCAHLNRPCGNLLRNMVATVFHPTAL